MEIYEPAEDSYLFRDFLKKYFKKNKVNSYLDMGTGSGILSEVALEFLDKSKILAADLNADAINLIRSKGILGVQTNLFKNINGKFDLITFNVPYLPFDKRESKSSQIATTGGKRGDEISLRFLKQAKKHLEKNGKIFLLISSLTPVDKLEKFGFKIVEKKHVFMEDLIILEFC
jgi:release factor glutamine methyltransferase